MSAYVKTIYDTTSEVIDEAGTLLQKWADSYSGKNEDGSEDEDMFTVKYLTVIETIFAKEKDGFVDDLVEVGKLIRQATTEEERQKITEEQLALLLKEYTTQQ